MKDTDALGDAIRRWHAAAESGAARPPAFRATLEAAARRRAQGEPRRLGPAFAMAAGLGVAALAVVLVLAAREPSLQDDIRLASTVSYDRVWRSPSDRLPAPSADPLLGSTPSMPATGTPDLTLGSAKEYL